jgi:casein kinase II subunit alpha
LTGNELYDYSVDLWGVGCMAAGLLLRREPFFRGRDNVDQLGKIIDVLGVQDLISYINKYKVRVTAEMEQAIVAAMHKEAGMPQKQGTSKREALLDRKPATCPIPDDDSMSLLAQLLVYDPDERLTAQQAMRHPFFDPVRARVQDELRSQCRAVPSSM